MNLHQNVYIFDEYQTLKKKKFTIQRIWVPRLVDRTLFAGSTSYIISVIIRLCELCEQGSTLTDTRIKVQLLNVKTF